MKTIKDFADQFGISAIVRRHFAYQKPVTDKIFEAVTGIKDGYPLRGALTYCRLHDDRILGLTHESSVAAYQQGQFLGNSQLIPGSIVTSDNQRNWDGGNSTAEGILAATQARVPVMKSPAVTYPIYRDFGQTVEALTSFGDLAVHCVLSEYTPNLWTESPIAFGVRVCTEITECAGEEGFKLFDLNFEQMVALYYLTHKKVRLEQIPHTKETAWMPTLGGGLLYSADQAVIREFRPDFTIVE